MTDPEGRVEVIRINEGGVTATVTVRHPVLPDRERASREEELMISMLNLDEAQRKGEKENGNELSA